jgi:hypothetical protein
MKRGLARTTGYFPAASRGTKRTRSKKSGAVSADRAAPGTRRSRTLKAP